MELNEKQLSARKANAQKSTGPKTIGGKYISSRNHTTHGFLADSILLPGESRQRFLELLRSFINQFQPATPYECDLVETMHIARWRQCRLWSLETASILYEQDRQFGSVTTEDAPTRAMLAHQSLAHPPRSLESLSRYESRLDRQYHRGADRLFRVQSQRRKNAASNLKNEENKTDTILTQPGSQPSNSFQTPLEPRSNQTSDLPYS